MVDITGLTSDQLKKLAASGSFDTQPTTSVKDFYNQVYSGYAQPQAKALGNALTADKVDGSNPLQYDMMADQFGLNAPSQAPPLRSAQTTVDATNPLDISRLGLTNDPFQTPAQKAITAATGQGGNTDALAKALMVTGPAAGNGMDWQPAVSQGPATGGDPWQKLRIGQPTQQPGMMTANRPSGLGATGNPAVYSQPTKPAITTYQAALQQAAQQHNTTPEAIHQQLMAQQSPDQRGLAALQANGTVDQFGMVKGGGHGQWR